MGAVLWSRMGIVVKLVLGIIDAPYDNSKDSITTAGVARILEDKYEVMQVYYDQHSQQIADEAAESMTASLESLLMGAPALANPFLELESFVTTDFKDFLSSGEIEQVGIAGVPTLASLARRSLRFKGKKAAGPRPSFIDTGMYQSHFLAWVEE